jgi:hypothetical protein
MKESIDHNELFSVVWSVFNDGEMFADSYFKMFDYLIDAQRKKFLFVLRY